MPISKFFAKSSGENHNYILAGHYLDLEHFSKQKYDSLSKRSNLTVIHMMRDPADLIISGFLYHRQFPIPPPETWLLDRKYNPCDIRNILFIEYMINVDLEYSKINRYDSYSGNYTNIYDDIRKGKLTHQHVINTLQQQCNDIKKLVHYIDYNQILRDLTKMNKTMEAVKLEAYRSLDLDLFSMAYNHIRLKQTNTIKYQKFYTSDFPLGDRDKLQKSIEKIVDELFEQDTFKRNNNPLCTKENSVNEIFKAVFISSAQQQTADLHITSSFVSHEVKMKWKEGLRTDPFLGEMIELVHDIIYR